LIRALKHPPMLLLTVLITAALIWSGIAGASALSTAIATGAQGGGPETRHIGLGAWTTGFYDPTTGTLNPAALQNFEQLTGKNVDYAHYYLDWADLASPAILTQASVLHSHGWTPVISTAPYFFSGCPSSHLPLYQAIASGQCDTFLRAAGATLAKLNAPMYLAFAYEMNNPDNAWSVPSTGSTPAEFVAAWRHMFNVFQAQGATNVLWVFDPNLPNVPADSDSSLYPGAAYVDWVGLDGYNWGSTQTWSKWTSFSGVFGGSYDLLGKIAPTKPMMVVEVNSTDAGGSKAAWYTDMLTRAVPEDFPRIKILMLYNENRTAQEHVNWLVNSSPAALRAYSAGVHSKYY
jgi:beta-mannanase